MLARSLTVVLPCFNEIKNIDYLIDGFEAADAVHAIARIIFVDDNSPDGTAEYIKHLPPRRFEIICLRRIHQQGLSSAVIDGVLIAATPYVAVMDSDGQHDPSDLIAMYQAMRSQNASFMIGSRFTDAATIEHHVGVRALISSIGNRIANQLLKRTLSDPLTGFFIFKRSLFSDSIIKIRPSGFKILLDFLYLLRNQPIEVLEYPIHFKVRHAGQSKLDSKVLIDFADQIIGFITKGLLPEKMVGFLLVGASGVVVHLGLLYALLFGSQLPFEQAQAIATFGAMISNFSLNNVLTFRRNQLRGLAWLKGLLLFILICSIGALANVGVAAYFFETGRLWWLSALAGIVVGTVFNFTLSKFMIWKP